MIGFNFAKTAKLATHLSTRIATTTYNGVLYWLDLATHLPTRIATGKTLELPVYYDLLATHLPTRIATMKGLYNECGI